MWGSQYYGQTYWGSVEIQTPDAPGTRPECGGIWGTTTWGQTPWGSHFQCGDIPPIPPLPPTPIPTPVVFNPGGGYSGDDLAVAERHEKQNRREDEWPKQRQRIIDRMNQAIESDDEDIATIVSLWLNLPK